MRGEAGRALGGGGLAAALHRLVLAAEAHRRAGDLGDRLLLVGHALDAHLVVDDLQVLHRRLQHVGGDRQHLVARVVGRLLHRRADGVGDLAAARAAGVGGGVAVAADDLDFLQRHAEGLRGDLREPGVGPGQVDRAEQHA